MQALRSLGKSPGFTAVALVTLALGIGACTAIFSVVHALLLSPLAYSDSHALAEIRSHHPEQGTSGLAPATFHDLTAQSQSFAALAAQYYYYVNLTGVDNPTLINSADVTPDYFRVFDVAPLLGRTWTADEVQSGTTTVVVLSHALWSSQFNARDSVVGEHITLDGIAYTVIGVMPASFKEPANIARLWRPMRPGADNPHERGSRYWNVFGRRHSEVSLANANAELTTFFQQLQAEHPQHYQGWRLQASDLHRLVVGDYRTGLLVVLGAVGCVMLITCANIAGLNIVRATARRKELALRTALGATRGRLLRQLLGESLLIALIGGALGVLLGQWALDGLLATLPEGSLPRADEISLDLPVLGAALVLTLFTGLASGLAPGFSATRGDPLEALKDQSRGTAGPTARRLRGGLVVAEIGLALMLLVGAGLLGRSFLGLLQQPPGVDADRLLTLTVSLSGNRYNTPARRWDFFARAEREVAAVAGVQAAGFTHTSPFRWGIPTTYVPADASNAANHSDLPQAFHDSVSVDFFKAAGVPVLAGRTFAATDDARARPVAVLNETAARRYFGSENPVGRFIADPAAPGSRFEVVGVVGDVRRSGLAAGVPLQVYRPLAQRATGFATLMVRTTLHPASLTKAVQAALWRIDPDTPVSDIATMETLVSRSVAQPRLHLTLFALFAALAVLLSSVGLYGLIAYSVAQRTREFGIRAALGASPRQVLTLVLREGSALIALGLALGLTGAFAAAKLLRSMIIETSTHDPLVFASVALLLTAVAFLACWLPARRATKINPISALRAE